MDDAGRESGFMRSNTVGWLMLAPTIAVLGVFGIVPVLYVIYVAFHQWNPFGANPHMVYNGADNFRRGSSSNHSAAIG